MLKQNDLGRVAVLTGGWSSERSISLDSGSAVQAALQKMAYDSFMLDLADPKNLVQALQGNHFDCAFIAMHGKGGEDGCIQGMLESMAKSYTGSGVLGSALAMNKGLSKNVWSHLGMPTPSWQLLWPGFDAETVVKKLGLPLLVKPVSDGSSIGISLVERADELKAAHSLAMNGCAQPVLAESYIEGEEYSVAFVGDHIFPPIRIVLSGHPFYNYQAKYEDSRTRYSCPGDLSLAETAWVQSLAWRAAEALGVKGWARVDMRRDQAGKFWLLEVNTIPGMTEHSLVPKAAAAEGMDFNHLVAEIMHTSMAEAD